MISTTTRPTHERRETRRRAPERGERTASRPEPLDLAARVNEIVNRRPAVGLAVGVVRDGRLESFHAHGLADIASNTPITADTVFRIASVTKTFTTIAIMQLWEQGLVDLDAPANDYLRAYKLIRAKPDFPPATVRQLLTHTSGIREVLHAADVLKPIFGELVEAGRPVSPLAEYYRGGVPIDDAPGTRYIYTDHGFATLGQIVEDLSGRPLARYMREEIFEPLGMAHTDLVRTERVRSHLATGYDLGANGAQAVADYELVTVGGGSAYSTPADMARYLAALLGGGANAHGSVLKPATIALMFEPHYRSDPRLPGVGLAFTRCDLGGHLAVEHGGILPGFNTQVFVAPDDGVGVMAFTNGSRLAMLWMPGEIGRLLRQLLGVPEEVVRTDVPQHPEIWGDLRGWYELPARLTDLRARMTLGAGAEVFVGGGRLMIRGLSPIPAVFRGFPLHPDDANDPDVFRIDLSDFGIGTARVVFGREPGGAVTSISSDLMPLLLRKQPAGRNPRLWATGAAGALAVAAAAAAVVRGRRGTGSKDRPA